MNSRSAARAPSQRQLRVGEELRHALVDILRRTHFRDPVLQDLNVTVTEVRVSPDLKNATAFVTPLGGEHGPETVAALGRVASFLRGPAARAVGLRFAPFLTFALDQSFEAARRIDELLRIPAVQRDLSVPERVNGEETDHDEGLDEDFDEDEIEYEDDDDFSDDDDDWDDADLDEDSLEYEDEDSLDDEDVTDANVEYEDDDDDYGRGAPGPTRGPGHA